MPHITDDSQDEHKDIFYFREKFQHLTYKDRPIIPQFTLGDMARLTNILYHLEVSDYAAYRQTCGY